MKTLAHGLIALSFVLGACSTPASDDPVRIGLLLSFSGQAAANSINSERALLLAVEAANAAGGIGGRRVVVEARDTQSDPRKVTSAAQELLDAQVAVIIGPDNNELAVQLKALLGGQTVILPSFTTTEFTIYKPQPWFVMGAPSRRMACELGAQLKNTGRQRPIVISDPLGYNSLLGWQLTQILGIRQIFLPAGEQSNEQTVRTIQAANADAYVLATLPPTASSLLYTLAALGTLAPGPQWYLSPTLHTPALLETVPRGMLEGARGVAAGTVAGAGGLSALFEARWQDQPLDDAYPFYDAGAIVLLALERAIAREGKIPTGTGLGPHLVAVTRRTGTAIEWNQIALGLQLLRSQQEIGFGGVTGALEFDITGQTRVAHTKWWTIGPSGFADTANASDCRIP